jgi:hypothetical protein
MYHICIAQPQEGRYIYMYIHTVCGSCTTCVQYGKI